MSVALPNEFKVVADLGKLAGLEGELVPANEDEDFELLYEAGMLPAMFFDPEEGKRYEVWLAKKESAEAQ